MKQHIQNTLLKKSRMILILSSISLLVYGWYFGILGTKASKDSDLVLFGFFAIGVTVLISTVTSIYLGIKHLQAKGGSKLFQKIDTREEALRVIGEAAKVFYVMAALQFVIGVVFLEYYSVFLDCIALLALGFLLKRYNSRFCAMILFLFSLGLSIMTILNMAKVTHVGGTNIFLALLLLYMSFRSIQATFTLYKLNQEKPVASLHLQEEK